MQCTLSHVLFGAHFAPGWLLQTSCTTAQSLVGRHVRHRKPTSGHGCGGGSNPVRQLPSEVAAVTAPSVGRRLLAFGTPKCGTVASRAHPKPLLPAGCGGWEGVLPLASRKLVSQAAHAIMQRYWCIKRGTGLMPCLGDAVHMPGC